MMNFFDSFNLSELSWNMTSQNQYSNFHQWWDRSELFCMMLLNIVFSCLLSVIEIKIIFWQLIENLAEFLSKSVVVLSNHAIVHQFWYIWHVNLDALIVWQRCRTVKITVLNCRDYRFFENARLVVVVRHVISFKHL